MAPYAEHGFQCAIMVLHNGLVDQVTALFCYNDLTNSRADKDTPPALLQRLASVILIDEKAAISFNTLIFT